MDSTTQKQSFTQLLDRGLAINVKLAQWCPTMDLLALLTADGHLHLHRLNWQRLWWISPESSITSLAWRPDGKQLAVGLQDGSLLILNTEDGETVAQKPKLLDNPITSLHWREEEEGKAGDGGGGMSTVMGSYNNNNNNDDDDDDDGTSDPPIWEDRADTFFVSLPSPPPGGGGKGGNDAAATTTTTTGTTSGAGTTTAAAAMAGGAQGLQQVGYAALDRKDLTTRKWPKVPTKMSIIVASSDNGRFTVCTAGLICLAALHLPLRHLPTSETGGGGGDGGGSSAGGLEIMDLVISPSLKTIVVVWNKKKRTHRRKEGSGSGGHLLYSTILDTSHLAKHAPHLHRMSLAVSNVDQWVGRCLTLWNDSCKIWGEASKEFKESIHENMEKMLQAYGSQGSTPLGEFQGLLTTGELSPSLQQFMLSNLGEIVLKKVARRVDAAVAQVHYLLVEHLIPAMEQLAFRLGELWGAAQCPPGPPALGIQPEEIKATESEALALIVHLTVLRRRVVKVGSSYRTFFAWLLATIRRLNEDNARSLAGYPLSHLDIVRTFLVTDFSKDTLADVMRIVTTDDNITNNNNGNNRRGKIDVFQQLQDMLLVPAANNNNNNNYDQDRHGTVSLQPTTIRSGMWRLERACASTLGRMQEATSPTIKPIATLCIGSYWPTHDDGSSSYVLCVSSSMKKKEEAGGGAGNNNNDNKSSQEDADLDDGLDVEELQPNGDNEDDDVSAINNKYQKRGIKGCTSQEECWVGYTWPPSSGSSSSASSFALLHITTNGKGDQGNASNSSSSSLSATIINFPAEYTLVDAGAYKDGRFTFLLSPSPSPSTTSALSSMKNSSNGAAVSASSILVVTEPGTLQFTPLATKITTAGGGGGFMYEDLTCQLKSLIPMDLTLAGSGGSDSDSKMEGVVGVKRREVIYSKVMQPLAVSATRGVGCVLGGEQRVMLFDLEDDEDEEEEEEEGVGGDGDAMAD
jgi:hypothetical protein